MEEWKSIPGYDGLYEASNCGRIRTVDGKVTSNARYPKRVWKQRILCPKYKIRKCSQKRDGQVTLWKDGKEKMYLVARLVAMTWCDGYTDGMTVNHKDGDTMNNNVSNLEWVSMAENIHHAFRTGLFTNQKPCTLINKKGEKIFCRSRAEASRQIGRNECYISDRIMKNRPIISSDGDVYGLV